MNNTMARAIALLAIAAVACIAAEPLYEENTDDAFRNALFSEVYDSALPEVDAAFVETKPKAKKPAALHPTAQKAALKKGVKKMSGQMANEVDNLKGKMKQKIRTLKARTKSKDSTGYVNSLRSEEHGAVMRALVDLKAYCMAARDKAIDMQNNGVAKSSSLVPFVIGFGKSDGKDIVVAYAHLMGKMRSDYDRGLGAFLLDRLNQHVLAGKTVTISGLTNFKNWYMLDHERLGLEARPVYFQTLAVRLTEFAINKANIHKGHKGKAVKDWMKGGNSEIYKMFLAKIMAAFIHRKQTQDSRIEAGAVVAESAAYREEVAKRSGRQQELIPMPPAGVKGGAFVRKELGKDAFAMPSTKVIKKLAQKKALEYLSKLEKKDASNAAVIKAIEEKMEGVTLRIATAAGILGAESTISPLVEIRGTLGTIHGKLDALPLRGQFLTQTFHTKDGSSIGTVERVALKTGKTRDPWLCAGVQIKVGAGKPWLKLAPEGGHKEFWLDSKPFNHGPYYGKPSHHVWKIYPSGTGKPSYPKKYSRKWPHCTNIMCMFGSFKDFTDACTKDKRCNGFSITADKDKGNGCLKQKCTNDSIAGYGFKTHDYYLKQTNAWARVLRRRMMLQYEVVLKQRVVKETKKKLAARKEKISKEKADKHSFIKRQKKIERQDKHTMKKKSWAKEQMKKKRIERTMKKHFKVRQEIAKKRHIRKNTCTVRYYKNANWNGYMGSLTHFCGTKTFHLKKKVEDNVSSFKFSSGCNWVELWDEDKCRAGDRDNRWFSYRKQPKRLPWDLNDDICAVRLNAKC